jgi:hypothetical protein
MLFERAHVPRLLLLLAFLSWATYSETTAPSVGAALLVDGSAGANVRPRQPLGNPPDDVRLPPRQGQRTCGRPLRVARLALSSTVPGAAFAPRDSPADEAPLVLPAFDARHDLTPMLCAWGARPHDGGGKARAPTVPPKSSHEKGRRPITPGQRPNDLVSEGGLEPPCPIRALAPQASASAYSATRTCTATRAYVPTSAASR